MLEQMSSPRITPWVGRLLAINAVVLLLTMTLFTSPVVVEWLEFSPQFAFTRPWTWLTYMFVHGGLWHLAGNSIALDFFGPPVEQRLGGRRFIFYYLYCGLGAAAFALVLASLMPITPFIGASGAVLGVALAFAKFCPDAELIIFPIPLPIKARLLVWLFVGLDLFGAMFGPNDGVAHVAHLGGLLFAMLYFGVQRTLHPVEGPTLPSMRPRGMPIAVSRVGVADTDDTATGRERRERRAAPRAVSSPATDEAVELDRLLDKINATGLDSLTGSERTFLDGVARRRRERTD